MRKDGNFCERLKKSSDYQGIEANTSEKGERLQLWGNRRKHLCLGRAALKGRFNKCLPLWNLETPVKASYRWRWGEGRDKVGVGRGSTKN